MKGHAIHEDEVAPKTFEEGRICLHPGCETLLSKYNKAAMCVVHSEEVYERACKYCGTMLPFTNEYFWMGRHGLMTACKECQGFRRRHPGADCNFGELSP